MTTKTPGRNRKTGALALTFEAQEALEVGDPVMIVGDYEVEKNDGSKPCPGYVSVANKGRVSTVMGSSVGNDVVPGDVTVEALGYEVRTVTAGAAITAGARVGFNGTKHVAYTGVPGTAGNSATVVFVGIALTGTAADGDIFDLLSQS